MWNLHETRESHETHLSTVRSSWPVTIMLTSNRKLVSHDDSYKPKLVSTKTRNREKPKENTQTSSGLSLTTYLLKDRLLVQLVGYWWYALPTIFVSCFNWAQCFTASIPAWVPTSGTAATWGAGTSATHIICTWFSYGSTPTAVSFLFPLRSFSTNGTLVY